VVSESRDEKQGESDGRVGRPRIKKAKKGGLMNRKRTKRISRETE